MKKTVVNKVLLTALGLVLSSGAPTQLDLAIAARDAAKPNPVRQLAKANDNLTKLQSQYSKIFLTVQIDNFGSQMAIINLWVDVALSAARVATQAATVLNQRSVMSDVLTDVRKFVPIQGETQRHAFTNNLNQISGALAGSTCPTSAPAPAPITPFVFSSIYTIPTATTLNSALNVITQIISPSTNVTALNGRISGVAPALADVALAGAAVATATAMEATAAVNDTTDFTIPNNAAAFSTQLNIFWSAMDRAASSLITKASSALLSSSTPAASVNLVSSLIPQITTADMHLRAFKSMGNSEIDSVMGGGSPPTVQTNYLAFISWANTSSTDSLALLNAANSLNGLPIYNGAINTSTEIANITSAISIFNTSLINNITSAYTNGLTAARSAAHLAEKAAAAAIGAANPSAPHTALSLVTIAVAASVPPPPSTVTVATIKNAVNSVVTAITNVTTGSGGITSLFIPVPNTAISPSPPTPGSVAAVLGTVMTNAVNSAVASASVTFTSAQLTAALGSITTAATTAASGANATWVDVITAVVNEATSLAALATSVATAAGNATNDVSSAVNAAMPTGFDSGISGFISYILSSNMSWWIDVRITAVVNAVSAITTATNYISSNIVTGFSTVSALQTAFNTSITNITDSAVKLALTPITTAATNAAAAPSANAFTFASSVLNAVAAVNNSANALNAAANSAAAVATTVSDILAAINRTSIYIVVSDPADAASIGLVISAVLASANAAAVSGSTTDTIKAAAINAATSVIPFGTFSNSSNYAGAYTNGYTTASILDFIQSTLSTHSNALSLISQFCFSWQTVSFAAASLPTDVNAVLLDILALYLSGTSAVIRNHFVLRYRVFKVLNHNNYLLLILI